MVAPLTPLHPKLTIRTLLTLCPLHTKHKFTIVLTHLRYLPVLGTTHVLVVLTLATKAVVLLASRTLVVLKLLVEVKDRIAACTRTPTGIHHMLLNIVMEGEIIVLQF